MDGKHRRVDQHTDGHCCEVRTKVVERHPNDDGKEKDNIYSHLGSIFMYNGLWFIYYSVLLI